MNLTFTPAQKVDTQNGVRWVQSAIPTREFWIEWRTNKEALSSSGIYVTKADDCLRVYRLLSYDPDTLKLKPANVSTFMLHKSRRFLLPFQPPLVSRLCSSLLSNNIAIDASDAGVGKSYHALAVCQELELRPAIVCTKTGIAMWKKLSRQFGLNPLFIINWESVIARFYKKDNSVKCSFPYVIAHKNAYSGRLWYEWTIPKGNNNICFIFDECHKGNGITTSQGKVFMAARGYRMICLSATLAESPHNIKNVGMHCDLFTDETFHLWLQKLGCYKSKWGAKWESPSPVQDMQRISAMLFPKFGGRLRKADIPGFPDIQNIAQSYPIKDVQKHNKAYQELIKGLAKLENTRLRLKARREQETNKEKLGELLSKIQSAQANKLTLNLRYRQYTEMLKVDLLVSLCKEEIENNHSVAIFVNFTETLKTLAKKLKCNCLVHGGQTGTGGMNERNKAIADFQADRERVIICNIAAGGIGISLHDLNGLYDRTALISPTYHAKQMVQVLGRIHRSGAKSKAINRLVYAAGTVEDKVCSSVSAKVDSINALNDADLAESDIFNLLKGDRE